MSTARVLLRDRPSRAIALATSTHVLIFRHSPSSAWSSQSRNASSTSLPGQLGGGTQNTQAAGPRCIVELVSTEKTDLSEYRVITQSAHGTLGLITLDHDVFLCVVAGASKVATLRPGETVQRILTVDFHCLNRPDFDNFLNEDINLHSNDYPEEDAFEMIQNASKRDAASLEHPCQALRKLLGGGSFYYSVDFDLTSRLQARSAENLSFDFDAFDKGYLWNSYMIKPLIDFRSRLSAQERAALDSTRLLTSAIRGFVMTLPIPAHSSPARVAPAGLPSTLSIVSRLSCRRAGTRFNARGIDDDGNVANFVETEIIFWSPSGLCFSYVQIRGSVPVFWEQAPGLIPGQQKVQLTRSLQATQPAFDKHFDELEVKYGPIHVINLLSEEKHGEIEVSQRYTSHINHSSLNSRQDGDDPSDHRLIQETHYDFHAQTRAMGYEAASGIKKYIQDSIESFGYCLTEVLEDTNRTAPNSGDPVLRSVMILQQQGVFRTNCLDCLDRTNLMQTLISHMALEAFLAPRAEKLSHDFLARHGTLWADNGDALSKIYAGTGALKSSFTRSGKMSIAGALADARKSATRMYINNFADKGRQTTMDVLLGRLVGQNPVYLFDPINDYVTSELTRRAAEYTSTKEIRIWAGTFNLNGRNIGLNEDLSPWLCPAVEASQQNPEIVAVGFQEIVELNPQHIMSTEPTRRQEWEKAVMQALNNNAKNCGAEEYILLRGGQLVGASLSIFVKSSCLKHVKNVEGSLKKTGMSGMAGNKGAVAIRLEMDNTSLCFVTAHLAAGFANYDERNRDFHTINHGLSFQRDRSIEDHDNVIWMGDFNYRIGLSDEKVRRLAKANDYGRLYENDQLNLQMVAGLAFPYYSEARILFMPTYKYDIFSDEYDTSEKARIPAWTDRVLRKGKNLRQVNYNTAPLRFSDHRPVYATFTCTIDVIDENLKGALSKEIYGQRKAQVGSTTAHNFSDETDDEDLLGYESIGHGLPPASSDRRKWWLDNGLPARSTFQPPSLQAVPNPNRPSNPFTPSNEPEWIRRPQSAQQLKAEQKPALPIRKGTDDSLYSPSSPSGARRPAPPVPKKPNGLSSPPKPATALPSRDASSNINAGGDATKTAGLPRRTTTAANGPTDPTQGKVNKAAAARNLMDDDEDDGGIAGAGINAEWTPLKPT